MRDQAKQITAQEYFQNLPPLHTWDCGQTWNAGGFTGAQLENLVALIRQNFPAPSIIETGCGNSTISFLLCHPTEVLSVCPDDAVFDRIADYCVRHSIPTGALHKIVGCSEWELPRIAEQMIASGRRFDFALIDGSHNWPVVFVDFCYIHAMTRKGSLIMVDDLKLHTARELANLLCEQPGFAVEADFTKSLIFRKTTDETSMPEWDRQPYVVRRSLPAIEPSLRRRLREAAHRLPYGRSILKAVKRIMPHT